MWLAGILAPELSSGSEDECPQEMGMKRTLRALPYLDVREI